MQSTLLKVLLAAFFAASAGTAFAAPDTPSPANSQGVISSDTVGVPQQQGPTTPPDCKKNPKDPRCDKK